METLSTMHTLSYTPRLHFLLGFLLLLSLAFKFEAQAAPQLSLAILELDAKGGVTRDEASIITDRLRAQFIQSGRILVLERTKMEAILKEQGFQQSAFCDDTACSVRIGKLLGVKGLITGSVSRLDTVYTLSARVLDIERGVIVREVFQDCECPLKQVLTDIAPVIALRLLGASEGGASLSPQMPSPLPPVAGVRLETWAGNGWGGSLDGPAAEANFNEPTDLVLDRQGNLLIADSKNHRIRQLSSAGYLSSFAGRNELSDLIGPSFADGLRDQARFNSPMAMALHPSGTLYIADTDNHRIRMISPQGEVSTLVGTGVAGYNDGNPAVAQFRRPQGIAVDAQGTVYVADTDNHCIRKVTPQGQVSTVAGSRQEGFLDGKDFQARFRYPQSLLLDAQGRLWISDTFNHSLRQLLPSGEVVTVAGNGQEGFVDGPAPQARFRLPHGLALDAQGALYLADTGNHRIRKLLPSGEVTTVAGNGQAAFADGNAAVASLNQPWGLALDAQGNLFVADRGNQRIRKILWR